MRDFIQTSGQEGLDYLIDELRKSSDGRCILIGGCGFDPRTMLLQKILRERSADFIESRYINELRPDPDPQLLQLSNENRTKIQKINEHLTVDDITVVNGEGYNSTAPGLRQFLRGFDCKQISHMVVDISALSTGIYFPIVKAFFKQAPIFGFDLHLVSFDMPPIDASIKVEGVGTASDIRQFEMRKIDKMRELPTVWVPHLSVTEREELDLVGQYISPEVVYPIVPFPAHNPRLADDIIYANRRFLEKFDVDLKDIVHASESDPLFLYRSLSTISEETQRLYQGPFGGRHLAVTPSGNKISGIGILLSGLINPDISVFHQERARYILESEINLPDDSGQITNYFRHYWLEGQPYKSIQTQPSSAA